MKSNTNWELVKELSWRELGKIKGSLYTAKVLSERHITTRNSDRINVFGHFILNRYSGHSINIFLPQSFVVCVGKVEEISLFKYNSDEIWYCYILKDIQDEK